jgi:hypothetical protein
MKIADLMNIELEDELFNKYTQMVKEKHFNVKCKWDKRQIEAVYKLACALRDYRAAGICK